MAMIVVYERRSLLGEDPLSVRSNSAGMCWVYFRGFDGAPINRMLAGGRGAQLRGFVNGYGHPLIYAGIVATGIEVELAAEAAVHHEAVRLQLFGVAQALLILGRRGRACDEGRWSQQ
jgi:low temperature requirement protein LtrA